MKLDAIGFLVPRLVEQVGLVIARGPQFQAGIQSWQSPRPLSNVFDNSRFLRPMKLKEVREDFTLLTEHLNDLGRSPVIPGWIGRYRIHINMFFQHSL